MLRMVNLISGGGSTNLAVLEAEKLDGKLEGMTKTVAIISSSRNAEGMQRAKNAGFPADHIWVVDHREERFGEKLLEIMDRYRPDYFHQLGWMPLTPREVFLRYQGLNQHLGSGGKWMYGVRRIYTHMRFCEMIEEKRPIPIFCQRVTPEYDEGEIVYLQYEDILVRETPEEAAQRLLLVEHQVQIKALLCLANGSCQTEPVPKIARDSKEEEILLRAKKEARNKYPSIFLFS